MQYGISVEQTFEMSEAAKGAGRILLSEKLHDIAVIYKAFKDYISNRYTTVEELLEIVSALIPHSSTVRNSEIIFDGFTGFTPISHRLTQRGAKTRLTHLESWIYSTLKSCSPSQAVRKSTL